MTTEASIGHGTLFQTTYPDSPAGWQTLAEVTSITLPNISRDSIDASHEESPNRWSEFISGMKDAGECTVEMNFIPNANSNYQTLFSELSVKEALPRQILFPDGSTLGFNAFLTTIEGDAPLDDKMSASATFKLSGEPTLTLVG